MNTVQPSQSKSATVTNTEWQDRKLRAIARGQGNLLPVYVERAQGSEIWDVEGKRYIDFGTGIAVCNTGHSHPKIVDAVKDQVGRFSHTCVMVTPYDSAVKLAEKLNTLAPGQSGKKTLFVTTGAEAVENSVKLARAYTGRRGVIAFNGGFHGRTMLAMALTGKISPYKNLFGPFPGEIFHAPFPIPYHDVSVHDSLRALETLFRVDLAPEDCAAIVVEPVQGEGGFYPAPGEFMNSLRRICDENEILLIVDEIQTGFGRTGRFFATEYSDIEPDMITVAKGVAGGFPLAAVVGKTEIMDAALPGGLGGTYGGSPVGCAAALAVLEIIADENLVDRANEIGSLAKNRLGKLLRKYPDVVGEVRADMGAMIAVEFVSGGDASRPNVELTKLMVSSAPDHGLILLSCGVNGNAIRLLPALTISDELLYEGLAKFEECLDECMKIRAE